jgi:hypothetical protein
MGYTPTTESREPSGAIGYAWLDPCRDFAGAPPAAPATRGLPPWQPRLHTYRLGHRRLRDAQILPVGVVSERGWFCDSVQYLPRHWPAAPWLTELAGHRLVATEAGIHLYAAESWPTQPLPGRWCVLNDLVAHRNLAHFFADLLPQLVAVRRLQREWPDLQLLGMPERYANLRVLREAIVPCGWRARPAPPLSRAPCLRPEELLLQPLAFNGGVGFLGHPSDHWWMAADDLREGLHLLRGALQPDAAAVWRGHWLCFSRDLLAPTEAPQGRVFSNYPELLERLSNAGVLVIDPGRHDIRALQMLVAQARGFVGIHGAGLMNALLARPGAQLIEIRPAGGCWRMLELLARTAGLAWQGVSCEPDPHDSGTSVIPIEQVLERMAAVSP